MYSSHSIWCFQRLIHVCGQIQAAPSENEEVQFLCTVAAKLRMYPNLVNFFLEVTSLSQIYKILPQAPGNTPTAYFYYL